MKKVHYPFLPLLVLVITSLSIITGCDVFSGNSDWPVGEPREQFPKDRLNFLVLGDWGRKGNDIQMDVAARLGVDAQTDSSRFLITTGDNFYNDGVTGLTDEHWTASFEDVYTAPSLYIPWYVTLGNHDYKGNVQAQIDYADQSDRWYLPARYYSEEMTIDESTRALFVFLDTTPMKEGIIDPVDVPGATSGVALQLKWLDETLSGSDAQWKIVIGHHPLFSVGEAHQDSRSMQGNLLQILNTHEVQVYFSGHAHSLQHIKPDGPVHYFISGSGSHVRKVNPNDVTVHAESVPGFLAVSLTPARMYVQMVDFKGETHHTALIDQ